MNPVPRWAIAATWTLSLVGLALTVILTIAHFDGAKLLPYCPSNIHGGGTFDCGLVTTSPQSYFLHIPVAILGLIQYTALAVIMSPWAWRSRFRLLHIVRFAMTAIGMAMVIWLVWAEAVIIGHFCEYCSGVHIVTVALFLIMTRVAPEQLGWTRRREDAASVVVS